MMSTLMTSLPDTAAKSRWVRFIIFASKFALIFFWMTLACEMLWEATAHEYLYDDSADPDAMASFIFPGDWVYGDSQMPISVVPEVVHHRALWSSPDEIKQGWTEGRIWCLWWCFFAVDLSVSAILARISWRQRINLTFERMRIPEWLRALLAGFLYLLLFAAAGIAISMYTVAALCLAQSFVEMHESIPIGK
jgi:hypothetical protein